MTDEQFEKLRGELVQLRIAIQSLNPDPTETIAQHQERQHRQEFRATLGAAIGSIALLLSVTQLVFTLIAAVR